MKTEAELRQEFIKLCQEKTPAGVVKLLKISRAHVSDIANGRRGISKVISDYFGYRPVHIPPPERLFEPVRKVSRKTS